MAPRIGRRGRIATNGARWKDAWYTVLRWGLQSSRPMVNIAAGNHHIGSSAYQIFLEYIFCAFRPSKGNRGATETRW